MTMAITTKFILLSIVILHVALLSALPRNSPAVPPEVDGTQKNPGERIVGGQLADIKDYPYQLSLQQNGVHACGASVISNEWALTAAHCVVGVSSSILRVRSGSSFQASGGTVHTVTQVSSHSSFNERTKDYDIAAVKVSPPFSYSTTVQTISLADTSASSGTVAVVSGWGFTYDGENQNQAQLRQVSVPIIPASACENDYPNEITARMICAGYANGGKDACQNDSGGPLVAGGKQIGVVSWGVSCGAPGFPGVYTDVAVLRAWIQSTTGV